MAAHTKLPTEMMLTVYRYKTSRGSANCNFVESEDQEWSVSSTFDFRTLATQGAYTTVADVSTFRYCCKHISVEKHLLLNRDVTLPNHCIFEQGISGPSRETPHAYKVHPLRGARLLTLSMAIKFLGFESPRGVDDEAWEQGGCRRQPPSGFNPCPPRS